MMTTPRWCAAFVASWLCFSSTSALAQTPTAPAAPPAAPPAPSGAAPQPTQPAAPDPLTTALAPVPGGLTAEQAGRTAAAKRHSVKVKQAELRAAQARVDEALVNYFPRLSVTATYTRLSEIQNSLGGGAIVGAANPGQITTGPCPGNPAQTCALDSGGLPLQAQAFSFPALSNSYSLVATLALPISDYVLRISQGYSAASHAESAKQIEVKAEELQVASDAKIAYFNWARAKGQYVVAGQAVAQAKAHLDDAGRAFDVGIISRADVLRLEAQLANAEQLEAQAMAFLTVAEEQLRIILQIPPDRTLALGTDVLSAPAQAQLPKMDALQQRALEQRLEIRALDETVYSLKKAESVGRAGYVPRIDAFGDVIYANPNQRIFPQRDEWNATWDVGVRVSWTLNDTFTNLGTVAEAEARTQGVLEQKAALMEALRVEVASAYSDIIRQRASIEAARRGLIAAEEQLRVRHALFQAGRATSLDLVDAETEATRARLQRLDAQIGLLVAQTRLDHATGADVQVPPPR